MNITGGIYNGRKILAPNEKITRPTLSKIRMSVFNILYSMMETFEGKSFLDMYGGSGIIGLEAISRGFEEVVTFEKNRQASDVIKSNYNSLGIEPNLDTGDSLKLAGKINKIFDVVYIDPPYMSGIYEKSIQAVKDSEIIILEHSDKIETVGFNIIQQKKYGDTYLTFLKK